MKTEFTFFLQLSSEETDSEVKYALITETCPTGELTQTQRKEKKKKTGRTNRWRRKRFNKSHDPLSVDYDLPGLRKMIGY